MNFGMGAMKRMRKIIATITIYASMIYAAPCEMFLMGANPLFGPYSGVGPENRELLGP